MPKSTDSSSSGRSLKKISQAACVSSTPLSTKNGLSVSFSNLSIIEGIEDRHSRHIKRKRKLEESVSSTCISRKFILADNLKSHFTNLNISRDSNDSTSTFRTSIDVFLIGNTDNKKYKRIRKGQDWNFFKPKRMRSIYNNLLTNQDYKKEVYMQIQAFKQGHHNAVIDMIQFLVDICGYQDFDVTTVWKSEENNISDLVTYMEENPPKFQLETGKYLFKSNSSWANFVQNLICKFMQHFLRETQEEDIDFENFIIIIALIICFTNSRNRSMRHTALVLVMKLFTVILISLSKTKFNKNHDILSHLFHKFSVIIENNCNLQDTQLDLMKIVCAEEIVLWFYSDPSLLYNSKYFNRLMRFVQNQSKRVRKAALKTCYQLITSDDLNPHLKALIEVFARVVGERVCDIDYSIAISAVKICTLVLDRYKDAIEETICNKIIYLVFGKHSLLAMAAGEFFIKYLGNKSEDYVIITLVCYIHSIKKTDSIVLLVEAILDCCPALSEWSIMIDYLLENSVQLTPELQTILICIMSESVQQSYAGKSKICRTKLYERQCKVSSSEITNTFINKMPQLLKKYKKDSLGLQMLIEILFIMNLEEVALSQDAVEIDNILSSLRPIFVDQTDKDTLESISKYLSVMCGNSISLINKYYLKIQTLKLAVRDAVSNVMKQLNKEESEVWMLRVLMLFTYHDLTEILSFKFFMDAVEFMKINDFTPNTIQYSLKCCYHFLKWRLGHIIDNALDTICPESLNEDVTIMKKAFDSYVHCCFEIMTETQEPSLGIAAFECICKVYVKFKQDLERPVQLNHILSTLVPVMENPTYIRHFMNHMHAVLFETTTRDTLFFRRFLLGKVIDLIHLNVIGFTESTKLYQYYNSHLDDYGDIFKSALKITHEVSGMAYTVIILQTLIYKYSQFLLSDAKNEPQGDAIINLQNLSKQFQSLMNRSASDSEMLLKLGIQYAISSEKHYLFFDIIKVFSKPLPQKEKQILLNSIRTKIPKAYAEDEHIKKFVWFLQNRDVQQVAQKDNSSIATAAGSTLNSTENYNIANSSTDSA